MIQMLSYLLGAVIVGESLSAGTTLITTGGASANLLLTNGTLVQLGENTKLLNALYQRSFWEVNKKQVSWSLRLVPVVLLWSFKKVTL